MLVFGVYFLFASQGHRIENTAQRNVLFCLDASKSMWVEDIAHADGNVSRLQAATTFISGALVKYPQNSYGLAVFANTPLLLSPVTTDFDHVRRMLEGLNSQHLSQGSELGDTVAFCIKQLPKENQSKSLLVVLSDGGGDEYATMERSTLVSARNSFSGSVAILGIGTKAGGKIPIHDALQGRVYQTYEGKEVSIGVDEGALSRLASLAKGTLWRLQNAGDINTKLLDILPFASVGGSEFILPDAKSLPIYWFCFLAAAVSFFVATLFDFRKKA